MPLQPTFNRIIARSPNVRHENMAEAILRLAKCVSMVLIFTSALQGQELPKIPQIQPFGIDGFRLMLQQRGLDATIDLVGTALDEKPEETVAVILGDLKAVTEGRGSGANGFGMQDQLLKFVRSGGALLVASDRRGQTLRRTNICGTWVEPLNSWLRANERDKAYHNYRDCPTITQFNRTAEPELFAGVNQLVSNRPSMIVDSDESAHVAWLPMKGNQPLMSVKRIGDGKMLFISDHSFFVNEMLVHGDNAQFANNVTKWLAGKSRSRLVIINDGQVLSNWTFGDSLPSVPLSSLLRAAESGMLDNLAAIGDSWFPMLNESIARSQQANEFNYAAINAANFLIGGRWRALRFAILIITIFLLVSSTFWLIGTRSSPQRWLSFQDWHQPRRRQRTLR